MLHVPRRNPAWGASFPPSLAILHPLTSQRFRSADYLSCFFRSTTPVQPLQNCFVYDEHEILIFLYFQPRFIQQRHRSPPPARLRFQTETQVSPRNPGTYDLLDAARVASDTRQVSLTPPSEGWSVTPSTPCEAWNDFDPPRYRAETSSQPQAHFGRICDRLISAAISPKRAIPNPVFSR